MKRVSMIATKPMRYGTRRLRAGDELEATREDARLLSALSLAADAPKKQPVLMVKPVIAAKPFTAPAPTAVYLTNPGGGSTQAVTPAEFAALARKPEPEALK